MKDQNLKEIWKDASGSIPIDEKWDVNIHRKRTSDKLSKTLRRGMAFDIIMKFIIATATFLLLMYSGFNSEYILFTVISIVFLLSMIITAIVSKKKLESISADLPVMESLEKKLHFMTSTYKSFMFSSAFTAPMFVFTMNCYYFDKTYGEMRFDDPVILIFLLIAFIIGLVAQLPVYKLQVRELEEAIGDLDEEKAKSIERSKKHQHITLIKWLVAGLVLMLVLFVLFTIL